MGRVIRNPSSPGSGQGPGWARGTTHQRSTSGHERTGPARGVHAIRRPWLWAPVPDLHLRPSARLICHKSQFPCRPFPSPPFLWPLAPALALALALALGTTPQPSAPNMRQRTCQSSLFHSNQFHVSGHGSGPGAAEGHHSWTGGGSLHAGKRPNLSDPPTPTRPPTHPPTQGLSQFLADCTPMRLRFGSSIVHIAESSSPSANHITR
jgi:hypothetical protein